MWHHFGHFHPGIAETVRYTKQENVKFARQIFDHLLAENCSEVRGYYITLEFLYEYLNDVTMQQIKEIDIEELWHLWLKNLNLKNRDVQPLAQKILQRVTAAIDKSEDIEQVYEFLLLISSRPTLRLTTKHPLITSILKKLDSQKLKDFYRYLKKRIHNATDQFERSFYLNDLFVLGDACFSETNEALVSDISLYIFQEASSLKIRSVLQKFSQNEDGHPNETVEQDVVEKQRDQLLSYFYSLLARIQNTVSARFKESKSQVLRGLDSQALPWNLKIAQKVFEKAQSFGEEGHQIIALKEHIQAAADLAQSNAQTLQNQQGDLEQAFLRKKLAFNNRTVYYLPQYEINKSLQAFTAKDDNLEVLEELQQVQVNMDEFYELKNRKVKKRKTNTNGEKVVENQFQHVLIDILIAQLTQSTGYLRDLVQTCFTQFVQEVDKRCLETLVGAITRDNLEYIQDMENGEQIDEELDD